MKIGYISDTELFFGNNIQKMDPRVGLLKGGPVGPYLSSRVEHRQINYGIVGTADSIERCKSLIREISSPIEPITDSTYGNLGFPGLGKKSPLLYSLVTDIAWEQIIYFKEIQTIMSSNDLNKTRLEL